MKTTCLQCGALYDSDAVPKQPDSCPVCALAAFAMDVEKRLIKLEDSTHRLAKAVEKHVEIDAAENRYNRLKRMEKRLQQAEDWITSQVTERGI